MTVKKEQENKVSRNKIILAIFQVTSQVTSEQQPS